MRNVFCTGLSTVLNLCASGILRKYTAITYVISLQPKNIEDQKLEFTDMDLKMQYAKDIANFFGHKIFFKELSNMNVKIKNNDVITSNLLKFFLPFLNGQQIVVFPEGASCYNQFVKKNLIQKFYSTSRYFIKKIIYGHYKVTTRWILTDRDDQVRRFEKNKNKIIISKIYFSNIKKCSLYIIKKYPELNVCKEKNIIFHPINQYLSKKLYKKWLEDFREIVGEKKLLVKAHENDYRDYRKTFEKFNCTIVPKKFITLPAELIVSNYTADYLGYYSTTMLHFKKKNINFVVPPDENLIKLSEREFCGLKLAMRLGL